MNDFHCNISRPITVLIADDNEIFRESLCELISQWDEIKVDEARNGLEAVEMFRKLRPDLLLLDLYMPHKTGSEVTQDILSEFPGSSVVLLVTSTKDNELYDAIGMGACGFILKDVYANQLRHLLIGWGSKEKP